jgi:hypothetical protein
VGDEVGDTVRMSTALPVEGGPNELRLLAVGERFSVYLNGEHVGVFEDDTQDKGVTGLVAIGSRDAESDPCGFGETWIWDLGQTEVAIAVPSPTPLPPPADDVKAVLDALDIKVASGYEADRIDSIDIEVDNPPNVISLAMDGQYENFLFSGTMTWGAALQDQQGCGVFFRRTDARNYYLLRITQSRQLQLWWFVDDELADFSEQALLTLPQDEGSSFTLWLVVAKDLLNVYIDGEMVAAHGSLESRTGEVNLEADAEQIGHTCHFEDAWVWNLAYSTPRLVAPAIAPKAD